MSTVERTSSDAEVRVWVLTIGISARERHELTLALTDDEHARMMRFHYDADARRFLVGRATLRRVLSAHLGVAPLDVPLILGANGKPGVAGGDPCVNVSHSGDVVLVGLARGTQFGLDVERVTARHASETRLDAFFSPREVREHLALPPELRLASFFHIWTSKEAILKAVATGLSLSLQSFDVSVDPRQAPALLTARCPELIGAHVSVRSLDVPAGHAAALAALSRSCTIRYASEPPS